MAVTLMNYCAQAVNNSANCGSWVQTVMASHHEAVAMCAITSNGADVLRDCLAKNDVPLPS